MRKRVTSNTSLLASVLALTGVFAIASFVQRAKIPSLSPFDASSQTTQILQPQSVIGPPCKEFHTSVVEFPPERISSRSNYLRLSDFRAVLVTDSHGHSEAPYSEHPTGQSVETAHYDREGERQILITTPVSETFTFTFRPTKFLGSIELVRGVGNTSPDTAVRYLDILLPEEATAMLVVRPDSIEPLRVDKDGDGTFETTINPTAYVTGSAAKDIDPPTPCLNETPRGTKTLVTITVVDSSGVEKLYYSLGSTEEASKYAPYTGPFEVDVARTPLIYVLADDKVGNRLFMTYKIKG